MTRHIDLPSALISWFPSGGIQDVAKAILFGEYLWEAQWGVQVRPLGNIEAGPKTYWGLPAS